MKKIPVGILGATGMVGQKYIELLQNHPWFEVVYVAASPQSAGKKYKDALKSGWVVGGELPEAVANLTVQDVADVQKAAGVCKFVFSAFEMPEKDMIRKFEESYAAAGMPVISNASAHRWTENVPMLIGEINPHHLDIIPAQQKANGWKKGFIVVKPNCSLQSYLTPIHALMDAGYEVQKLDLPFAPKQPIIYREEPNRPQPKKDRDADKGMAVTVGRLREDNIFDFKFAALSHNTIRGAAGGGILNAELAFKKGFFS